MTKIAELEKLKSDLIIQTLKVVELNKELSTTRDENIELTKQHLEDKSHIKQCALVIGEKDMYIRKLQGKMTPIQFMNPNYKEDVKYLGKPAADQINAGCIEDQEISAAIKKARKGAVKYNDFN